MIKCMFQGCDREATIHFPCIYVGYEKRKILTDLCNFHYFYVCRQEPVGMKIKESKRMDEQEAIIRLREHFILHDDERPTPYLDEAADMACAALANQAWLKENLQNLNKNLSAVRSQKFMDDLNRIYFYPEVFKESIEKTSSDPLRKEVIEKYAFPFKDKL